MCCFYAIFLYCITLHGIIHIHTHTLCIHTRDIFILLFSTWNTLIRARSAQADSLTPTNSLYIYISIDHLSSELAISNSLNLPIYLHSLLSHSNLSLLSRPSRPRSLTQTHSHKTQNPTRQAPQTPNLTHVRLLEPMFGCGSGV